MNDPIMDALLLSEQLRTQEAIALIEKLVKLDPWHARAWYILGILQMQVDRYEDAIFHLESAFRYEPQSDFADSARFCYGYANLALGRYGEGFWGFEYRSKIPLINITEDQGKQLTPLHDINGKSLLIYDDSGHGDIIQFARYLPKLVELGAEVIAAVRPALLPAFATTEGVTFIDRDCVPLPKSDFWIRWMSLGGICQTKQETDIPPPTQLANITWQGIGKWESKIIGYDNFNVGLCWLGNHQSLDREYRVIPFSALDPLLVLIETYPRLRFFSLQKHTQPFYSRLIDLDFHDFSDTAHAMKCLDLVITVDTANAHMAGTVGVPTWLFVDKVRPYWVWAGRESTSPWYPSIKLYRQDTPGSWTSVVQRMVQDLEALLV